jgi:hypothetical protein
VLLKIPVSVLANRSVFPPIVLFMPAVMGQVIQHHNVHDIINMGVSVEDHRVKLFANPSQKQKVVSLNNSAKD